MSVVIETTLGDITVDLYTKDRPRACLNFLKLCKIKYYNYSLFHTVSRDFIAQTGDPTGSRKGGESIFGVMEGPLKRYFESETQPRIKHTITGLVSFVGAEDSLIGSQFFVTLAPDLTYLDNRHCVFGEVVEGLDVLELLNDTICDTDNRPYQDIRITHTVVLDDPFPDVKGLRVPSRSPSPSAERLQGGRIAPDEEIDETVGKDLQTIEEIKAEREAKARATILEMVGDIPDAEMAPPENVLFVCKLNPVTTDDDLEIIFSRFGKIKSCEVIRDRKTGDSLQYAFIEFDEMKACEDAYFKMDNVLIDDRRIHVDFSQSVAKVKWLGKGRGVAHYDDKGRKTDDKKNDIGKGNYKRTSNKDQREKPRDRDSSIQNRRDRDRQGSSKEKRRSRSLNNREQVRDRSRSPHRRSGRYPEETRDRHRYKPYSSTDTRADWKRRSMERKKDDYYTERNKERRRDRSNSRDSHRRVQTKLRKEDSKKSSNRRATPTESSETDDDRNKRNRKSKKPIRTKKTETSSSSSEDSESDDVANKQKYKSKQQKKKKLKDSTSSDDSEEDYKKSKNSKSTKKRKGF